MVFKSLLLLAVAGGIVARNGTLGPTNNYIAPTGLEIGTIKQVLFCNASLSGLVVSMLSVLRLNVFLKQYVLGIEKRSIHPQRVFIFLTIVS